ncbi:TolC family protein [Chthoniobacter flavus]|uniref:TolC family protein n=1 Tax=Chthoniobacter flavus TaxID=191863 RepID=UPI00307A8D91
MSHVCRHLSSLKQPSTRAIIQSLAHDPVIDKVHADVTEAQGFAKTVKADLLPQLSIEGRFGAAMHDQVAAGAEGDTLMNRRGSVLGRQHLWDGGYFWNRWQDAKQRVVAKELLDKAQRESTAIGIVEAYLDVVRARKQIELAKQSVAAHQKVLDLAKKRAEAAGNQADIELSSARYNLARTLVLERELALHQAEAAFTRWVGHNPPAHLSMPDVPEVNSLREIDPTQNFHYLATLKQREAAELEKKALLKKYYPRFYLEGAAGLGQDVYGTKGRDNDASILIVGSWDILDGGKRKGEVQQATADIDRQIAIIEETLVLLNQDINARWQDYRSIDQRLKLIRDYANSLDKTVKLYQEQFDLGSRPLLSLLDIQNEVISASIRIEDEVHDRALLSYRLLFFGGRLIRDTVGAAYLEPASTRRGKGKEMISKNVVPTRNASTEASGSTPGIGSKQQGPKPVVVFRTTTNVQLVFTEDSAGGGALLDTDPVD